MDGEKAQVSLWIREADEAMLEWNTALRCVGRGLTMAETKDGWMTLCPRIEMSSSVAASLVVGDQIWLLFEQRLFSRTLRLGAQGSTPWVYSDTANPIRQHIA